MIVGVGGVGGSDVVGVTTLGAVGGAAPFFGRFLVGWALFPFGFALLVWVGVGGWLFTCGEAGAVRPVLGGLAGA